MAEKENSLLDYAKLGKKGFGLLDKAGLFRGGDSALGTGNVFTSSHAMQPGSTGYAIDAVGQAGPGFSGTNLGTGLAGAGFAALASFVAMKIAQNFGRDNPALTFKGGTGDTLAAMPKSGGADGVQGQEIVQKSSPGDYVSEKFGFNIGTKDLGEGGKDAAEFIGKHFDNVFSEMQENTDVDINEIIAHAFELTNFMGGGTPQDMVDSVVNKVTQGIQTGKPLSPHYSRTLSAEGTEIADDLDERRYVIGSEQFDPDQEAYNKLTGRERSDAIDPSTLNERDRKLAGESYTRATYAPIEDIEGDPDFSFSASTPNGGATFGTTNGGGTVADTVTGGGESAAITSFWDEFKNEWFSDENNAKDLYQGQADYLADAARTRNLDIEAATGDQTANIDALVSQYAKPVNFSIMGDPVSFVPRGARNPNETWEYPGHSKHHFPDIAYHSAGSW